MTYLRSCQNRNCAFVVGSIESEMQKIWNSLFFIFPDSWSVFACDIGSLIGMFNERFCSNHISTASSRPLCCEVCSHFAWNGVLWNIFQRIPHFSNIVEIVDEEVPNSLVITHFFSPFSKHPIIPICSSNVNLLSQRDQTFLHNWHNKFDYFKF